MTGSFIDHIVPAPTKWENTLIVVRGLPSMYHEANDWAIPKGEAIRQIHDLLGDYASQALIYATYQPYGDMANHDRNRLWHEALKIELERAFGKDMVPGIYAEVGYVARFHGDFAHKSELLFGNSERLRNADLQRPMPIQLITHDHYFDTSSPDLTRAFCEALLRRLAGAVQVTDLQEGDYDLNVTRWMERRNATSSVYQAIAYITWRNDGTRDIPYLEGLIRTTYVGPDKCVCGDYDCPDQATCMAPFDTP